MSAQRNIHADHHYAGLIPPLSGNLRLLGYASSTQKQEN